MASNDSADIAGPSTATSHSTETAKSGSSSSSGPRTTMGHLASDANLDFTLPFQITRTIHRAEVPYILSDSNPQNHQAGKIVVVTGGGTGIGAAAARVWVRAGARGVIIVGRRLDKLERTAFSLQDISRPRTVVVPIQTDICLEDDVKKMFAKIKTLFGRTADVVIANAGVATDWSLAAEDTEGTWWSNFEVNVRGLRNTVVQWIRSQPDPADPSGTLIEVNTGLSGTLIPGASGYAGSKMAAHRFMEFVATEYPRLRVFTLLPGIVDTGIVKPTYLRFALDNPELTGSLALYLSTPRADYLKGCLTSVNWDYEELEMRQEEIRRGALKMQWVPILPCCGGKGFQQSPTPPKTQPQQDKHVISEVKIREMVDL